VELTKGKKWRKYCHLSQDWRQMNESEYLEKADTDYLDYVSCHIKVHGEESDGGSSSKDGDYNNVVNRIKDSHRPWTRRFKDYLELLHPQQGGGEQKLSPFYFFEVDNRGDIQIGKWAGPDGSPIIRVDGPHSAPSEHYSTYGTLMIIGAGIGLTPCASILCSLIKYRWKKNFSPGKNIVNKTDKQCFFCPAGNIALGLVICIYAYIYINIVN
jgi:hypothetical protein